MYERCESAVRPEGAKKCHRRTLTSWERPPNRAKPSSGRQVRRHPPDFGRAYHEHVDSFCSRREASKTRPSSKPPSPWKIGSKRRVKMLCSGVGPVRPTLPPLSTVGSHTNGRMRLLLSGAGCLCLKISNRTAASRRRSSHGTRDCPPWCKLPFGARGWLWVTPRVSKLLR